MLLCKVSVYERVFKFIEFNLGRIELTHIGTDSMRRGRPNRGHQMVEAMIRGQHFELHHQDKKKLIRIVRITYS